MNFFKSFNTHRIVSMKKARVHASFFHAVLCLDADITDNNYPYNGLVLLLNEY